jgi:hypothetical protein
MEAEMDDQSHETFRTLQQFRDKENPESLLLTYCADTLGRAEGLMHDYKQKTNCDDPKLGEDDKKNIAKTTSGFANSAGGIVIWGLKDKSLETMPIDKIERFQENLLGFAANCVVPRVAGLDACVIPARDSMSRGYLVYHVPQSELPPHQINCNATQNIDRSYYLRTGEGFQKAEHFQLEDLFGRRPRPKLKLVFKRLGKWDSSNSCYTTRLALVNEGRGPAKSVCVCVRLDNRQQLSVFPSYSAIEYDCYAKLINATNDTFEENGKVGIWLAEHQIIYPQMQFPVTGLRLWPGCTERQENLGSIETEYIIYSEGSLPFRGRIHIPAPNKQ